MKHLFILFLCLIPVFAEAQSDIVGGEVKLRLNTVTMFPAPPAVLWPGVVGNDTAVSANQFPLRACIRNYVPASDTLRVFLNREELARERTLKVGKESDGCPGAFAYVRTIPLREGPNTVELKVTNPGGPTSSTLTVKYYKPERRLALVIGNSTYPGTAALPNPVNDATDMAQTLTKLGFKVILKTNVSRQDMAIEINRFADELGGYQVGLFYYAGHGLQIDGDNYLVPTDAIQVGRDPDKAEIKATCIPTSNLFDQLDKTNALAKIIILDACRNNPFEGTASRTIGGDGGLAEVRSPIGSIIAYSTGPGKKASDGKGRNGLYTKALLETMQQPNLPVEMMFKAVAKKVDEESKSSQEPWYNAFMKHDFYFLRR